MRMPRLNQGFRRNKAHFPFGHRVWNIETMLPGHGQIRMRNTRAKPVFRDCDTRVSATVVSRVGNVGIQETNLVGLAVNVGNKVSDAQILYGTFPFGNRDHRTFPETKNFTRSQVVTDLLDIKDHYHVAKAQKAICIRLSVRVHENDISTGIFKKHHIYSR